jgi:hypothetical protein
MNKLCFYYSAFTHSKMGCLARRPQWRRRRRPPAYSKGGGPRRRRRRLSGGADGSDCKIHKHSSWGYISFNQLSSLLSHRWMRPMTRGRKFLQGKKKKRVKIRQEAQCRFRRRSDNGASYNAVYGDAGRCLRTRTTARPPP